MEQGKEPVAATLEAARMRLRPILMTSLAFVLGVLPLAIATGAGSGSQNAIGTGVLGGTIAATVLGIFFVPLFFVVIKRWFRAQRAVPPSRPRHAARRRAAAHGESANDDAARLSARWPSRSRCCRRRAASAPARRWRPMYRRPAAPVPATLPGPRPTHAAGAAPAISPPSPGASTSRDERLRAVIDIALANNRDLRVAALNIDKARAQYQIQRATLYPSVGATGSGSAQRLPGDFTVQRAARRPSTNTARRWASRRGNSTSSAACAA